MANKQTYTVDEIVKILKDEAKNETIEGRLLKPKLIRELYKQLGTPTEKDFPDECRVAGRYWKKVNGYTLDIGTFSKEFMNASNNIGTDWRIQRASGTKMRIVEDYTRAGWHCQVQAYNVLCSKYVQHPKHKDIWVYFYSSRDCNRYEYIIEKD